MVTAVPNFFHLFLSPIFVYFAKKVNPRCLQLYLFVCLFLSPSSFYYAGNPYLFFGFGANTFPPSTSVYCILTTMSLPPHPSAPRGGGIPGHSGRGGNKLYLMQQPPVAIALPPPPLTLPPPPPPRGTSWACHPCRCCQCAVVGVCVNVAIVAVCHHCHFPCHRCFGRPLFS
jgi:hypothetical protein